MINHHVGAVGVVVVLPRHPAVKGRSVVHAGLDVARFDPAVDYSVGGKARARGPRGVVDRLDIAELHDLTRSEQDAVVTAAGDVDPAPRQRRVVDLLGGIRGVLLRVLIALLGRGIAVVQVARARIAAPGLLYFISSGMGCTETL